MKQFFLIAYLFFAAVFLLSCKKFLDEKPEKSLAAPATLQDVAALLDNNNLMNLSFRGVGEASADNYYLTTADWQSQTDANRNTYVWEKEIIFDQFPNEWSYSYSIIYNANLALETMERIDRNVLNQQEWDNAKGMALFLRAHTYHKLALAWAKVYDSTTAGGDLSVPLRLTTDFNETSVRATNAQVYGKILDDLLLATQLLPANAIHVMRPSKAAAFALLSRVYLSMGNYSKSGYYADASLQQKNTLINYNTLSAGASYPFSQFNAEVLFHAASTPALLNSGRAKIDSALYRSYAANDLRKTLFFKDNGNGSFAFRGSYNGSSNLFMGIATDEMYLTKAECLARQAFVTEAMNTLNGLLQLRWKTGTFIPFTATTPAASLSIILTERRKELLMRDLRWMDLKRLNKEGAGVTVTRNINNQRMDLIPNDLRYALPLPQYVLDFTAMPQNPR